MHGFPVAGIGASAGGLEAFRGLLKALPVDTGIAFVLIPHLDPTHASMMVDLLGGYTAMPVLQASDGMPLERDHVYVIPPQAYLSVSGEVLRLSAPQAPHGARLPLDFFLNSLAEAYGERAICVILSGTGADGSIGLKAVSEKGGLVIVQDPDEAAYDGMPRSAIATRAVNLVLPVDQIPPALMRYARHPYVIAGPRAAAPEDDAEDRALIEIIELLRARTTRDFTHYRKATLLRRIRRRMAAAGIEQITAYVGMLRENPRELELLAKDFLIHVTSFFRDPAAFKELAKTIIPELVQRSAERPIRVWVPGCSTGEEAYSLAILFFEEFAEQKRAAKLQIFASDVSAEALDFARTGIYPDSIRADVSEERLQRFFTSQDQQHQVSRELREAIVFTAHDLLADPPFSRLDLVSCRNLLIYLQPEEQRKVLSVFHFSLHEGGYLFLGASETIGQLAEYFEPVAAELRIFRRAGHARPEQVVAADLGERVRALWPRIVGRVERRHPDLAEIAQRALLDNYAPTAMLVDRTYRTFFVWGPTDFYLRVAHGEPTRDAIAMLREGLASRFRAVVRQASRNHTTVTIGGAQVRRNGDLVAVRITARPLTHEGEELLLVTFVDEPEPKLAAAATPAEVSRLAELEQELEDTRRELEATIRELEDSNQELSAMNEEALSINEEFQSTNEELETSREELQSLNEELTTTNNQLHETVERQRRTSDDLQNILNSSDLATLFLDEDRNIRYFTPTAAPLFGLIASDVGRPLENLAARFAGIDLLADARAVLANLTTIRREVRSASGHWYLCSISPYRTHDNRIEGIVVTLAEITELKIGAEETRAARAYAEAVIDTIREPLLVLDDAMQVVSASRSFFRYFDTSAADTIGRSLPDTDAHHLDVPVVRAFLDGFKSGDRGIRSCEAEIDLGSLGRHTLIITAEQVQDNGVAEKRFLITLNDITEFRHSEHQLSTAMRAAEQANLAKSKFLAAVSHDLRQPLQTLTFLHDVLQREVKDASATELLDRAEDTLSGMSDMLKALLDINQLETGTIRPQALDFPINDLLDKLGGEFAEQARAHRLRWRMVRCGLAVRSDPLLLEQMLRNLLSNAIRYTAAGGVLLGCRRRGDRLLLEVWDTGVGISQEELPRIFEEYHQAPGRVGEGGLGLGLAIVQRLGELLGHVVSVRSRVGKGSVFAIEVPIASPPPPRTVSDAPPPSAPSPGRGAILLLEDNPALREALQLMLAKQGYGTAAVATATAALAMVRAEEIRPDLIVSDYLLPGSMNGAQAAQALRAAVSWQVPVIFVTGDIRTASLRDIELARSIRLTKPVKPDALLQAVQRYLAAPPAGEGPSQSPPAAAEAATVFIVDDDKSVRETMRALLEQAGYRVQAFAGGEALLAGHPAGGRGCFVIDVRLPGISGFELLARLVAAGNPAPAILITGHGDIAMAVSAMKAGAFDFLEKPVQPQELLLVIDRALRHAAAPSEQAAWQAAAALRVAGLTGREREVMDHVVAGRANKEIAARLRIAQRTIETHRANVMRKMGAASLSELVRLALAAHAARNDAIATGLR
jgi:two-component system, chemotaxis family, CheB/CheR fusion protein